MDDRAELQSNSSQRVHTPLAFGPALRRSSKEIAGGGLTFIDLRREPGAGNDRVVPGPRLLDRLRQGQRAQVWHELRQLGSRVREPALVEDAQALCDEMARRARHNIEVIVRRLIAAGYRFHSNDDSQNDVDPFVPATDTAPAQARWLEDTFGPVPLTVLSWIRIVGDVWLDGSHPDAAGQSSAADPLVIELEGSRYPGASIRDALGEEHAIWREEHEGTDDLTLFALPVAPDRLTKDNVSGGLPYILILPDACADALFVGETTMPFVAYLNQVFEHGGFPYTGDSDHTWWRIRTALAEDLLPL